MTSDADQTAVARWFIAGLAQGGMRRLILSPGSRSTPLALAAHASTDIEITVVIDERTAGFTAVGAAQVGGRPVGLLCSSGTAGANYLPALSEASMADLPIVAITADRPPEHQHWGAGQAFTQTGLFHRQVRLEFEMPTGGSGGFAHAERAGKRAADVAMQLHGPVHVNWPFRLPLEPAAGSEQAPIKTPTLAPSHHQDVPLRAPHLVAHEVDLLVDAITNANRPVIVAGPNCLDPRRSRSVQIYRLQLALETIGAPVIADVLSGLSLASEVNIDVAPIAVRSASVEADLIVRIGDTPTAKDVRLWWESLDNVPQIMIDPRGRWQDPSHLHTHRFESDADVLFEASAGEFDGQEGFAAWRTNTSSAGRRARLRLDAALEQSPWSEAHVARSLAEHCPPDAVLLASSSMPVRDIDMFASRQDLPTIVSNRGVNGIDGVIATSIGISLEAESRPVYVLIGDIACLHDIGSLYQAARLGTELTIVIANNDGGAIFSMLPIVDKVEADTFETLFTTPHGLSFDFLGAHPGIEYTIADESNFLARLTRAADSPPVRVVEVRIDAGDRFAILRRLRADDGDGSSTR